MALCLRLLLVLIPFVSAGKHAVRRVNMETGAWEGTNSFTEVPSKKTSGFVEVPEELQWGIWLDGKDARQGRGAYGSDYETKSHLPEALKVVYESAKSSQSITDSDTVQMLVELYARLRVEFLDISWRKYFNPPRHNIALCHKKIGNGMQNDFVEKIMANVSVVDYTPGADTYEMSAPFQFIEERCQGTCTEHTCCTGQYCWDMDVEWKGAIRILFQQYVAKLPADPKSDSAGSLKAVGWFLYNLAWLHPLRDRNGRSRTLLMQHELRRLGLAGGSFMYNNNKVIYFTPLDIYISQIREGMEMYNKAAASGVNPWTDQYSVEAHIKRYDQGYNNVFDQFECARSRI